MKNLFNYFILPTLLSLLLFFSGQLYIYTLSVHVEVLDALRNLGGDLLIMSMKNSIVTGLVSYLILTTLENNKRVNEYKEQIN